MTELGELADFMAELGEFFSLIGFRG